jgi:hypothetical protein
MSGSAWQDGFASAVTDPGAPVPDGVRSVRGDADALRFAVYRNNVHVGLVEALRAGFPVVERVVGEAFFTAMARAYAGVHKPKSPVMMFYGEGFGDFIDGFPPAAGLPYLGDLARLEFAWTGSYHAADAEPLTLSAFAGIDDGALAAMVLKPHPAARLVSSPFAVGSIWLAQKSEQAGKIDAGAGEAVLVTRPGARVSVSVLPERDIAFAEAVFSGASLGEAAEIAMERDSAFDFGAALTGLCAPGAFSER